MANPLIHSKSSVKLWGGIEEDYLPLHNKMDCSKKYYTDNRHRALTHNMFFIFEVMIPIFGEYITNSDGKVSFDLQCNTEYLLKISASNYEDKTATISKIENTNCYSSNNFTISL